MDRAAIYVKEIGEAVTVIVKELGEFNTINSIVGGEPVGSLVVLNIVRISQADYDAGTPNEKTLYLII